MLHDLFSNDLEGTPPVSGWNLRNDFVFLSAPSGSANAWFELPIAGAKKLTGEGVMDDDVMSNAAYYRSREEAERASARQAPTDDIRKIHLQLAESYAKLADEFETRWRASPLMLT